MEKEYYYYLGEVYCKWNEGKEPKRHSEEVSGMVEFLEKKTPVEAYNSIVELNKIAFIEKLELTLEDKSNQEFKMIINKLEKFQ